MKQNYLCIWRQFNKFIFCLDRVPEKWEDRAVLFCAFLVDQGKQSRTICSYLSAIKGVLKYIDYKWNDDKIAILSLTRACRQINDRVYVRLPIKRALLEVLLFELERLFKDQMYLRTMYRTLFALAYYGLFRIGELAQGDHPVKACNIHIAQNKAKILIYLRTSKTHGLESRPQKIKISAENLVKKVTHFCPFMLMGQFINIRGGFLSKQE